MSLGSLRSLRTVNSVNGPTDAQRSIIEKAQIQSKLNKKIEKGRQRQNEEKQRLKEEKKKSEEEKTNKLKQEAYAKEYATKKKLNIRFNKMVEEIKKHKQERKEYMAKQGVTEEQFKKYDDQTKILTTRLYKRLFRYLKPEKLAKKYQPGETLENSKVALDNYKKALTDLIIKLVKDSRNKTEEINKKLKNAQNNNEEKTKIKFEAMNKKQIDIRTLSSLILALDNDTYRVFLYFMSEYKPEIGIEYIDIIKEILVEQYYFMKPHSLINSNSKEKRLKSKIFHTKQDSEYKSNRKKYPKKQTNKKTKNQKDRLRKEAKRNKPLRQVKAQLRKKVEREKYDKNFPLLI